MRKLVFVLALCFTVNSIFAQDGLAFSADLNGFYKIPDDDFSAFIGFSLNADYLVEVTDNLLVGPEVGWNRFAVEDGDKIFESNFKGSGIIMYRLGEVFFVNGEAGYVFGGDYLTNNTLLSAGLGGKTRNGLFSNINYTHWNSDYQSVTIGLTKFFSTYKEQIKKRK